MTSELSRSGPIFDLAGLSKAEIPAAQNLQMLILVFNRYADNFERALDVFDFAAGQFAHVLQRRREELKSEPSARATLDAERDRWAGWMHVAARDAVMTLYQFGQALKAVRNNLGSVPKLRPHIDSAALKTAESLFYKARFPQADDVRHAVAHSAEKLAKIEEDAHRHGAFYSDVLSGRSLVMTHKGIDLSVPITVETLRAITDIRHLVNAAFRAVERGAMTSKPRG
jgi:hypothetical protein